MVFLVKPRYDADGNDLAPETARKTDKVFLQHVETANDEEGAIILTEEDDILDSPLVLSKVNLVSFAEELLSEVAE